MRKEISLQAMQWGEMEITGPRHILREDLLYKAFYKLLREGKVLDAGCGSGSMLVRLLKGGYAADGLEASRQFVASVNKRIMDMGLSERAVATVGTITKMPWSDGSYDGLIAGEVLEHVEDDGRAVREFRRVLKANGVCVASVPAHPHLWYVSDEWAGHKRRYTKDGLIKLFEDNGFKVEEVFSWGFPLIRLYNRFIFSRWVEKHGAREAPECTPPPARSRMVLALSKILSTIFRFDSLFNYFPWGIGIILCARKR